MESGGFGLLFTVCLPNFLRRIVCFRKTKRKWLEVIDTTAFSLCSADVTINIVIRRELHNGRTAVIEVANWAETHPRSADMLADLACTNCSRELAGEPRGCAVRALAHKPTNTTNYIELPPSQNSEMLSGLDACAYELLNAENQFSWETLFKELLASRGERLVVVIDEFKYLKKSKRICRNSVSRLERHRVVRNRGIILIIRTE